SGDSTSTLTSTVPIPPPAATRARHTAQSPAYNAANAPSSQTTVLPSIRILRSPRSRQRSRRA
ncbi:MAG TPA: hypothetical protein VII58_11010, partial [Acidobacteriaceae bacterium]